MKNSKTVLRTFVSGALVCALALTGTGCEPQFDGYMQIPAEDSRFVALAGTPLDDEPVAGEPGDDAMTLEEVAALEELLAPRQQQDTVPEPEPGFEPLEVLSDIVEALSVPTPMVTTDSSAPSGSSAAATESGGAPYLDYEDSPQFNTEEYSSLDEHGFLSVATNPTSTFSADVDTASYANLRRMIEDGATLEQLPAGALRAEELLNYFDYGFIAPPNGEPFGMNVQVGDCPWNPDTRLMVLGIQAQMPAALDETDSNLVFLIDISGSMEDANKLGLFKKTLPLLVEQLGQGDRVSIVVYASGTGVVLEGAAGDDRARIIGAVDDLKAGGSTNGGAGLVLAYQCAEQNFIEGGNNRIIMVSDGDLNVGITSASDLERYVSAKRQTGIYLTVLGFGTGNYKDNKMETIADKGNGNYHYIDRYEEAEKVFVEDLTSNLFTVADDVKLQLEFNPAYIKGYRQIGYENRALSDADFADDSKDAAEMGAGDQVIVVYEIVMADSALEVGGASLKYQENLPAGVENGEWLTLSLRYKEPGQPVSKGLQYAVTSDAYTDEPDKDWVYVSSVVEFYLVATASDYAGSATLDEAIARAEVSSGNDFRREEFVQLARMLE